MRNVSLRMFLGAYELDGKVHNNRSNQRGMLHAEAANGCYHVSSALLDFLWLSSHLQPRLGKHDAPNYCDFSEHEFRFIRHGAYDSHATQNAVPRLQNS